MFSPQDFPTYANRIRMIVFSQLDIDVTRSFRELSKKQQRLVNIKINEYIYSLPENFDEKINEDFNIVCGDELFEDLHIKAAKMKIRPSSVSEIESENDYFREALSLSQETQDILEKAESQNNSVAECKQENVEFANSENNTRLSTYTE